jgi:Tfp pilus assembly protein PilE
MTQTQKVVLGFAIGVLVCLLLITGILVRAATIGWKAAMRSGDETAAIQSLKTIDVVQKQYYATHARKFGTFEDLTREQLLDVRFRREAPVVDGYVYQLTIAGDISNARQMYLLTADSLNSSTGTNHFYRDSSSDEVRFNPEHRAGPNDPAWKKQP